MDAKEKLIVALDVDTEERALQLAAQLACEAGSVKIGLELFSSCGPEIVRKMTSAGARVFLDLKFHDIPNTVARAAAAVVGLGAFMVNVHSLGGVEMMRKAAEAARAEAGRLGVPAPKVIAVTVLTSMDENALKKAGINDTMNDEVLRLALLAKEAGLDGVVASPNEAAAVRRTLGKDFLIVTPGVRPAWAAAGDQKRIATPAEAVARGADYIVVGRPITGAKDPVEAARKIVAEMNS